jgi:hypothetical protein
VMRSAWGGFLLFACHGCFIERKCDLRLIVFFLSFLFFLTDFRWCCVY